MDTVKDYGKLIGRGAVGMIVNSGSGEVCYEIEGVEYGAAFHCKHIAEEGCWLFIESSLKFEATLLEVLHKDL